MNVLISGKDFQLTPTLKTYVEKKFLRFERHHHPIEQARVELDVDHNQRKGKIFRVTVHLILGKHIIKAGTKAEDMHSAIDLAEPKLEKQLERLKARLDNRAANPRAWH